MKTGGWGVSAVAAVCLAAGPLGAQDALCPALSFGPTVTVPDAGGPASIATADFNRDNTTDRTRDLVVANATANEVASFLGSNGTYGAPTKFAVGTRPVRVILDRFSSLGDGSDIVTANYDGNDLSFLRWLSYAGPSYAPAVSISLAPALNPIDLVAVDLNADGSMDLAVADFGSNEVSVLLGRGDGTFDTPVRFQAGDGPSAIAYWDFDLDGHWDLIVANAGAGTVSVLRGDGTGAFSAPVAFPVGAGPVGLATTSLDGDLIRDVVTANRDGQTVSVLRGIGGAGMFAPAVSFPAGGAPNSIAVSDMNGDFLYDVVVTLATSNAVAVLTADGTGALAGPVTYPAGQGAAGVHTDFASSGSTASHDILVANGVDGTVSIYPNTHAALPSAVFNDDPPICPYGIASVALANFIPGATYRWTSANGTITSGADTDRIVVTPNGSTGALQLTLRVTNSAGCSREFQHSIPIRTDAPSAEITAEDPYCAGRTAHLASVPNAGSLARYTWSITNGTIGPTSAGYTAWYSTHGTGTSTITVEVETSAGCRASGSKEVSIIPGPDMTITAPARVCGGGSGYVASVAEAAPGTTYSWSQDYYASGTITSPTTERQITFSVIPNRPLVKLYVMVFPPTGCTDIAEITIPADNPTSHINASSSVCSGSSGNVASLLSGAGETDMITWTAGNGTITSGQGTAGITYTAGPSGSVTLDVTVQTVAGCSSSSTKTLSPIAPPVAAVTAPASVCRNSASNVASTPYVSGATYAWTATNATITSGATSRSVTFSVGSAGPATLQVTVTGGGCVSAASATVGIGAPPDATISAPAALCAGATGTTASVPDAGTGASYSWTVSNGSITGGAGTRTIAFTAGASGVTTVSVSVTTSTGCIANASKTASIAAFPSATISAPSNVCAGATGSAGIPNAGAGATYSWSLTGGVLVSGSGTSLITFSPSGSDPVVLSAAVTTAAGCSASGSANVGVDPPPSGLITAPTSTCASSSGNTASVPDAGAGATYTWSLAGGNITAGTGTRAITWTAGAGATASLSVAVVTAAGCASTSSASVAVAAPPSATITTASSVRRNSTGNTARVPNAGDGATYAWSISNGTITSGAGTASIRYKAGSRGTLSLNVTVRNASGCAASSTKSVTVTN